jgi:NAD(P)H dehydrogenase (quinone)
MPIEVLESMNLKQRILDASGGPVRRWIAGRWLRGKDAVALARFVHARRPKDAVAQWEKVKNADALAFIAPVFWLHFPAILKGWFERVFTYGEAYALTAAGWHGEVRGRIPLLQHKKALVISTTLFLEADYERSLEAPMARIIDDRGLRYPGIKKVEHVYFYGAAVADDETRRGYLDRAYELGRGFAQA